MASAGKSYTWQKIQDQLKGQYEFEYVSSDETKHAYMKKFMATNPHMSKDDAFQKCAKASNKIYDEALISMIKNTKNLKENQLKIIYLDKNHPAAGGIGAAVSKIDQYMPEGVSYTKLYLIPEIEKPLIEPYPFSYEFAA